MHSIFHFLLVSVVILDEARDGVLLRDIKRLTKILGSVVERDNPEVYDIFSRFVAHGVNRQKDVNDAEPLSKMIQCAKDLSNENALGVMRLFSIALNLVNSAEVHHRMRVLRELEREADRESQVGGPLPMTEDSMRGTIQILLDEGYSKDQIFDAMINQKVEIVLTAHPTEVSRRTMLEKYKQITEQLEVLDRKDLNPYMEEEAVGTLKRIVGKSKKRNYDYGRSKHSAHAIHTIPSISIFFFTSKHPFGAVMKSVESNLHPRRKLWVVSPLLNRFCGMRSHRIFGSSMLN